MPILNPIQNDDAVLRVSQVGRKTRVGTVRPDNLSGSRIDPFLVNQQSYCNLGNCLICRPPNVVRSIENVLSILPPCPQTWKVRTFHWPCRKREFFRAFVVMKFVLCSDTYIFWATSKSGTHLFAKCPAILRSHYLMFWNKCGTLSSITVPHLPPPPV